MARSNRRWNQGLFPIDEALLEELIDCSARAEDEDAWEEGLDDDSEPGALVWHLEEERKDAEACDHGAIDPDPAAADDIHAVNMRVLNDYLRRRLIDVPDPIVHTLH